MSDVPLIMSFEPDDKGSAFALSVVERMVGWKPSSNQIILTDEELENLPIHPDVERLQLMDDETEEAYRNTIIDALAVSLGFTILPDGDRAIDPLGQPYITMSIAMRRTGNGNELAAIWSLYRYALLWAGKKGYDKISWRVRPHVEVCGVAGEGMTIDKKIVTVEPYMRIRWRWSLHGPKPL